MSAEVSFDSNIIQLLLIIGIILLMGGYFYYENLKIKNQLLEFEYKLNKFSESLYPGNQLNEQERAREETATDLLLKVLPICVGVFLSIILLIVFIRIEVHLRKLADNA